MFFIINLFNSHIDFQSQNAILKAGFTVNPEIQIEIQNTHSNSKVSTEEISDWYLTIPTIQLKGAIAEGTTRQIMDQYIGHFEESKKWVGNVCLAAHNRGYEINYFANIKNLKEGDKIFYYYKGSSREYLVVKNYIIKDTDLTCLEDTEDNTITLITCVENEPNYRRCVKAIEN